MADPFAITGALESLPLPLGEESRLYVAWPVRLTGLPSPAAGYAMAKKGATPWPILRFRTPSPLAEHQVALETEIQIAADFASARMPRAHYQIEWDPGTGRFDPQEFAFLLKRASVAILGADPEARVVAGPVPAEPEWLSSFYAEEVGAYLDGLVLSLKSSQLAASLALIQELDPGRPVVGVARLEETPTGSILAEASRSSRQGIAVTLFDLGAPQSDRLAELIEHAAQLAVNFLGDFSVESGLEIRGAAESFAFVRGEDLSVQIVARTPPGTDELVLEILDPTLQAAERMLPRGEAVRLGGVRRTVRGLEVRVANPLPVELLRIERQPIEEQAGVAEKLTVITSREPSVEEILRQLQAAEDRQRLRLRHYQARNATTLRFQAAGGVQAVEATFEGPIFVRQGEPYEWAWQGFLINGVRWRHQKIPELPLIQPEKAATLPLEIAFTRDYRYRLVGTDTIRDRSSWVVEFVPVGSAGPGRSLFRGRVWIDRELSVRVRTRAVQLGLEGDVISNEEEVDFFPVNESGQPTNWTVDAYYLPLRTTGQQLYSILNTATIVEREVVLSEIRINGDDFDQERSKLLASKATMVRDTPQGLRYLVPQEGSSDRVIKEGFDTSKLFAIGGVFYDDSLDYPLPLAGLNYFDLAFRGKSERQVNAFFGGVLGIVNYSDPRLFGSRFDIGADLFALAIRTSDQLYRAGVEQPLEEVQERPARVSLKIGHPLGNFAKLTGSFQVGWTSYGRGEETASGFAVPEDHLTHRGSVTLQFSRQGYRAQLSGSYSHRSRWEPWGFSGNPEYRPEARDYWTWEVNFAKNWYLSHFRRFGLEVYYGGGKDLDRFSKYQFGFFGGNRVRGYQIGKVRAEETYALHTTYGFQIGGLLRLDAVADAAWATDRVAGLDRELLAGVGLQGTVVGPWQTLISLDIGAAVSGPDDGFTVYLVFLKLFD